MKPPSSPAPLPPLRGEIEKAPKRQRKKRVKEATEADTLVEAPTPPDSDGWYDTPSLVNQYTSERWKTSRRQCPTEMHYFSLPADLDKFNALQHEFLPVSAPRRILISSRDPDFCPADGTYRMLVLTAKIQYRKLVQDTKTSSDTTPPP